MCEVLYSFLELLKEYTRVPQPQVASIGAADSRVSLVASEAEAQTTANGWKGPNEHTHTLMIYFLIFAFHTNIIKHLPSPSIKSSTAAADTLTETTDAV